MPDPAVSKGAQKWLPVAKPSITEREVAAAEETVRSGWISMGPRAAEFEEEMAAAHGKKYGIACCSGTTALHLALACHRVGPGDEVVIPTLTMVAVANVVRYQGAIPVFVDSEPWSGNPRPADIKAAITPKTKAVIIPHLYGEPARAVIELSWARPDIALIEDCAEAHYARLSVDGILGPEVGCLADYACFSFYANKIVTCFPAGTKIHASPHGNKSLKRGIEDIRIGQEVLSYNECTSEKSYKQVIDTQAHQMAGELSVVSFSNGKRLRMTGEHPVFVVGRGMTAAAKLAVGDRVIEHPYRGHVTVAEVSTEPFVGTVYNLTVADNHTYFAGGILVHNCGEGGMVLVDDEENADRLRQLRAHAFTPGWHFHHKELAFGYRMTDMQAAIGLVQHARREELLETREYVARWYGQHLAGITGEIDSTAPVRLPRRSPGGVWWVYPLIVAPEHRDLLREALAAEGVETRTYFQPLHKMPYLLQFAGANSTFFDISETAPTFQVAEELADRGLYLPLYPGLEESDAHYVADIIKRYFRRVR